MKETEVYELCPHCGLEAHLFRDIEADGYKAYCPNCGGRLMLCDECMHGQGKDCGGCDYDTETDSCKHNPTKPEQPKQLELNKETKLLLDCAIGKYNKRVQRYCTDPSPLNDTEAYKCWRYIIGICRCLETMGYCVMLEYAGISFHTEISGYKVSAIKRRHYNNE